MQILVTLEIATRGESRFTNQLIYVLYLCAYMRADWLIDFYIYVHLLTLNPLDSEKMIRIHWLLPFLQQELSYQNQPAVHLVGIWLSS